MSGPASSVADRLALALLRGLLAAIAVVMALVGLGVLTWAGFTALTYVMDPAWAGLVTGATLLGLAGVLCLVALMLRAPDRPRREGGSRGGEGAAKGAADPKMIASDAALAAIREHPKSSSLVALFAGLVLGVSPELRRAALDALE
ncbi:hypothetical protein [Roseospira navarrensis]|uniref:Uncharacterized protein n=1 Tax=Roseospira navarrensis TaxID=140058 RepID=A0A7X1ZIM3_9PROT|nr:hypothetical protein [Roseospira navarrensis]MQX38281.1 hypothetical protein [Roseospira navarrensis]